jgi:OmpA-OmpF porin, OOP family
VISLTALLLLQPSLVAHHATLPIMGGTTSNLGGVEAPPPPPPPPPPPQIPACVDGPFVVFFDWANDEISPQAQAVLDNAASAYQICRQAQVVMAGHADRSGPDQYNVGLSQRRAANVRAYLARRGIPDGVMTTVALGESRPQVDTADGVREPLNRRVKITFGPDSDW